MWKIWCCQHFGHFVEDSFPHAKTRPIYRPETLNNSNPRFFCPGDQCFHKWVRCLEGTINSETKQDWRYEKKHVEADTLTGANLENKLPIEPSNSTEHWEAMNKSCQRPSLGIVMGMIGTQSVPVITWPVAAGEWRREHSDRSASNYIPCGSCIVKTFVQQFFFFSNVIPIPILLQLSYHK